MPKHLSRAELQAALPQILDAPKDEGVIDGIIIRPAIEQRQELQSCSMSLEGGMKDDHWALGCWKSTDDGAPHPDVQICMMMSSCIGLIAQERDNWAVAGDNLFIDMDLTPGNMPPGTRISMGSVILEISDTPHNGCAKFIKRYGKDACVFVNTGDGDKYRLRGIYGRVVQDGTVSVGDKVTKLN
jgi:hypothetical protein